MQNNYVFDIFFHKDLLHWPKAFSSTNNYISLSHYNFLKNSRLKRIGFVILRTLLHWCLLWHGLTLSHSALSSLFILDFYMTLKVYLYTTNIDTNILNIYVRTHQATGVGSSKCVKCVRTTSYYTQFLSICCHLKMK